MGCATTSTLAVRGEKGGEVGTDTSNANVALRGIDSIDEWRAQICTRTNCMQSAGGGGGYEEGVSVGEELLSRAVATQERPYVMGVGTHRGGECCT